MNRLFLCLLLCTFVLPTYAQFTVQLFEKSTTLPLINAEVKYEWTNEKSAAKNSRIAITDKTGKCDIDDEALKNLAVFFVSHPSIGLVTLSTKNLVDNNYILYLSNQTRILDEVVVSSDRTENTVRNVPRQVEVISKQQIAFANQQNTADLLFNQSNVYIQKSQQGGGSPILRGFEANRVLLVVDGVRLNNAIYRAGHLQNVLRVDQNSLDKVEVVFGPGSLLYGSDAIGGVISLQTKQAEVNNSSKFLLFKNNFFTRYSSANSELTYHYDVNFGFKKWASFTSITHSDFGNVVTGKNRDMAWQNVGLRPTFIKTINGVDQVVNNPNKYEQVESNYRQTDIIQKFIFKPSAFTQHTLNFQYSNTSNVPRYDRLTDANSSGVLRSAQWYYGPEKRLLVAYQFTNLRSKKWFDKFTILPAYQYIEESRNDRSYNATTPNLFLRSRNEKVDVLSLNIDFFKGFIKHKIHYGFDGQYNQVNSSAKQTHILNGSTKTLSTRYPEGGSELVSLAAFITHQYQFNSKWLLVDGIRLSHIESAAKFGASKDFFSFLPTSTAQQNQSLTGNIGIIYQPKTYARLYANASNAFRAPNIDDLSKIFDSQPNSVILPNSKLKPEQSITTEVGLNLVLLKNIQWNTSVFYTRLYNAIVVSSTQVNGSDSMLYDGKMAKTNTLKNALEANVYGGTTSLTYSFKQVSLYGSLTYTVGKINDSVNTPLDHIPPVYGKVGTQLKVKSFQADLYTQYCGAKKLADYNPNGEDNLNYATTNGLPSWYTLNFKVQYNKVARGALFTVQAGVENILDIHYRLFASGISAPGRNFYTAVRVSF